MKINYLKLKKRSLFYHHYIYLDVEEYFADPLFLKYKVMVRFGPELMKEKCRYRIIFCKVFKKQEEAFKAALQEMANKMLLCGYADYEEFCEAFYEELEEGIRDMREERYEEICSN